MRENRHIWFGHVQQRPVDALVRTDDEMLVKGAARLRIMLKKLG